MTQQEQDLIAYALFEARQSCHQPMSRGGVGLAADAIARALNGTTIDFDRDRFDSLALKGVAT
jgi:hypothetical protein